jgi:hypothetical protein
MISPVELSCFVDAARRLVWSAKASLGWAVKEDVFVDSIGIIASCRVWLFGKEVACWSPALPYVQSGALQLYTHVELSST